MGELRHKDVVAGKVYENEYENINQHIANGQTANDMLYFNGSYWIRATPQTIRDTIGLSNVIWKDVPSASVTDTNRTATLAYTDLDLTGVTSANTKIVILFVEIHLDSITAGSGNNCNCGVRKNGTTPTYRPYLRPDGANYAAGGYHCFVCLVGMDSGQIIEYELPVTGTVQFDTTISVLGYIE